MKQILSILKERATLIILIVSGFLFISNPLFAQGELMNSAATDDYSALRAIVPQASLEDNSSGPKLSYRLNEDQNLYIRYFIGANTFTLKSDIDLFNRIIYAKIQFSPIVKPYDYQRSKIDSLYLLISEDTDPLHTYLYNPEADAYGKIIDQGKFTLVELYQLSIRKGKTNPLIDSGSADDRLIVKKVDYLYDTGKWYKIPNSKNQLIDFVRLHYKKSISKKSIESGPGMKTLEKYN